MKQWSTLEKLVWLFYRIKGGAQAIIETITGNLPLVLQNAIQHSIKSLTRYGLCTQDGTPAPDAPVDIMCNNGPLRYGALGANLFDPNPSAITLGWYVAANNGKVLESQTNFMLSQYIPIEGDKKYVFFGRHKTSNRISSYNRIAWYSASKTYMTTVDYPKDVIGMGTAPLNARFARLSCNLSGESAATGTPVTYAEIADYNWTFAQADAEIPYEPFVGGIYTDGTDEVLTVSRKNLINPDAAGAVNGSYINDSGVLSSDNTSFLSDYIPVVEGETYTAQGYKTSDGYANLRVHGFDASKTWTRMLAKELMQTNEVTSTTFVIPSGVKYVRVCGYIGYRGGIDAMLELGSSASTYEPYTAQTITDIPMLLSVGNYKDEAELISGLLTHKVGIRILTGEETDWALSDSGTTHRFRGTKPSNCYTPASRAPSVCTHFKYVSAGSAVGGMFIGASQYWYFIPTDQTIDTVDEWTDWLASQYAAGTPVIVLYPLATETTEHTTAQHLVTHEGTNTVDSVSNVSPLEAKVEYYATQTTTPLLGMMRPTEPQDEPQDEPDAAEPEESEESETESES